MLLLNAGSYSRIVIPIVQEILQEYPELQFQQDNAKGHAADFTKEVFEAIGIEPIFWPPNSPDLSPTETIWDEMTEQLDQRGEDFEDEEDNKFMEAEQISFDPCLIAISRLVSKLKR